VFSALVCVRQGRYWIVVVAVLLFGAVGRPQRRIAKSPLTFSTTDQPLLRSFDWAKQQALAYVSSGQDPVGDWYEAALPGRNAFCMRDVSHQAMGAQALGLSALNKNMLSRFAQAVSASRDWAGYWEIDRDGNPSSADYMSDDDFWYNLPANFDVMNAAFRMFTWTGDTAYITDPAFLNFYRRTVTDYVHQWQLEPASVLSRPRIMNRRLAAGKFVNARGIPGYTESRKDFNVGSDLLAAEYRALRLYAELLRLRGSGEEASQFDSLAAGVAHVLENHGWTAQSRHFFNALQPGGDGIGTGDAFVLYFQAAMNPEQMHGALDELKRQTAEPAPGIEEQSYRPEILFHFKAPEEAYGQVLDLSRPDRERREYPEVSFAIIGSIVTGMMGVNVVPAVRQRSDQVLAENFVVQTLPRLSVHTSDAELHNLPVRHNVIDLRHQRDLGSTLRNLSGPQFTWRASFDGSIQSLMVNGNKVKASHETAPSATPVTYVDVPVPPGQTIAVTIPK
jgi:hypothetical protein